MPKAAHLSYISVLTVLSALAVMFLHTNGCFWDFTYGAWWPSANIIECVFYFAVPVFFMISGATLMDYRERYSTKEFFKKRAVHVLLPFLFWSVAAVVWNWANLGVVPASAQELISKILNTEYVSYFWFFPALFALYMAIPFISLVPAEVRKCAFGWAIVATALTVSFLPFLLGFVDITWPSSLAFPAAGGYVLYALIGYWVSHYELTKQQRLLIYIAGAIGFAAQLVGTYVLSNQVGEVDRTFKGYLNAPCLLYSVAIFVAFRYLEGTPLMTWLDKTIGRFSGLAFGPYLLQYFFFSWVALYTSIYTYALRYRIFGALIIFAASLFVTWLIKKVPVLKHVMG